MMTARGIPTSILWKSVYRLTPLTFQPDFPLAGDVTSDGLLNDLPECQWLQAVLQHVTLMRAVHCPSSRERGFGFQWEGGSRRGKESQVVHPQIPHAPNC